MSISCHVIVKPSATPQQIMALGGALWRWCVRTAGDTGLYQYLDNQALADLMDGRLPAADRTRQSAELWGVHFGIRAGAFPNGGAVIDSLRRELPADGVENILAGSVSCGTAESGQSIKPGQDGRGRVAAS